LFLLCFVLICFCFVLGVFVNSADDLLNGDDVYEAIGGILHDVAQERTEADIK
jgi:hypothetical protein